MRCEDRQGSGRGGKAALEAHCWSIDDHSQAPLRPDRVRGRSETVWRFVEEKGGQETSIHLETLVDPRGGLPTWVVDKAGKSAAVKIVRALIRYTSDRYRQHKHSKGGGGERHAGEPMAAAAAALGGSAAACAAGDNASKTSSFWSMFDRARLPAWPSMPRLFW